MLILIPLNAVSALANRNWLAKLSYQGEHGRN